MASAEITELLHAWGAGNEAALHQLAPLVETELRRLAGAYMARERPGHMLQPTALVNEAFLRLVDTRGVGHHAADSWAPRSANGGASAHPAPRAAHGGRLGGLNRSSSR